MRTKSQNTMTGRSADEIERLARIVEKRAALRGLRTARRLWHELEADAIRIGLLPIK